MDAQTLTIITTLAVLMIGVTGTSTKHVEKRIDDLEKSLTEKTDAPGTRLGKLEAEVGALKTAVAKLNPRLSKVEAEIGELKATVVRMDSRLHDLATGRHAPLIIIPDH